MPRSTRIDSGPITHLPVCDLCGWRGHITLDEPAALVQAVRHERIAHPGQETAADRLRQRTGRPRYNGAAGPRGAGGRFTRRT